MTIKKIKDSTGQEHAIDYNALENKPEYHTGFSWIIQNAQVPSAGTLEVDVSSYLPDDENTYLVSIEARFACAVGVALYVSTDLSYGSQLMCRGIPAGDYLGCNASVLVGPQRKLMFHCASQSPLTGFQAACHYYIRVS